MDGLRKIFLEPGQKGLSYEARTYRIDREL